MTANKKLVEKLALESIRGYMSYLIKSSKDCCEISNCTEDEHYCESYAYFDLEEDGGVALKDVCISDYARKAYDACVPLPITEIDDPEDVLELIANDLNDDVEITYN